MNEQPVAYGGFAGELEVTDCPTCGRSAGRKLLFKEGQIGFYQCERCNLQFASPRFTESSMLKIYDSDKFTSDYQKFRDWNYGEWKQSRDRSYTVSCEKVKLIKEYLSDGSRVLDVGCSIGQTVFLANLNSLNAEGIEPSKELAEIAVKNLGVPVQNTQIQDFPVIEPYDGIVIWDVLEHLYDPLEVLRACSDQLISGGYLFAQVPNHKGLGNRIKAFLCRLGLRKTFKHFGFPGHVYSFDKTSLAYMFEKVGLRPFRYESWPSALMDAKTDPLSKLSIYLAKRFALTDYITVVAIKNN